MISFLFRIVLQSLLMFSLSITIAALVRCTAFSPATQNQLRQAQLRHPPQLLERARPRTSFGIHIQSLLSWIRCKRSCLRRFHSEVLSYRYLQWIDRNQGPLHHLLLVILTHGKAPIAFIVTFRFNFCGLWMLTVSSFGCSWELNDKRNWVGPSLGSLSVKLLVPLQECLVRFWEKHWTKSNFLWHVALR